MTKNPMRFFIWGGALLLCCIVAISYMEETYGFDQFYDTHTGGAQARSQCSHRGLPRRWSS